MNERGQVASLLNMVKGERKKTPENKTPSSHPAALHHPQINAAPPRAAAGPVLLPSQCTAPLPIAAASQGSQGCQCARG